MENNHKVHPLLQHVDPQLTAVTLSALALVIWGAMFPITVFAAIS